MARLVTRATARAFKVRQQQRIADAERRIMRDTNAQGYLTDDQSDIDRLMRGNRAKGF